MRTPRKLKYIRVVIAVACFAAVLAAFLDYRDFVPAATKHAVAAVQFAPSALALGTGAAFSLACLVILAATLALGRVYCSTLCPLGVFQDIVSRTAAFAHKISGQRKLFLPFRPAHEKTRHLILVLALLAVAAGWGGFALAWLDPYSNFGRFAGTLFRPPVILANNLVATLAQKAGSNAVPPVGVPWAGIGVFLPVLAIFGLVTVMSAWRGRLYCNTVCPVGTLLGLVSRRALWRLSIDRAACVRCGDCLKSCKAQCIDLRTQTIDHSRCVGCFDCVAVCDENGVGLRWLGGAGKNSKSQNTNPKKIPDSKIQKNKHAVAASSSVAPPMCNLMGYKPAGTAAGAAAASPARRAFIATLATAGAAPFLAAANTEPPGGGGDGLGLRKRRRGRHRSGAGVIAPPGSRGTREFTARCTACQLCVSACPSHVIEPALLAYGTLDGLLKPRLNFDRSFCNFDCTVCGEVCPDGAIQPLTRGTKHTTRIGVAEVRLSHCIVITDDTACGACAEHCPTAALQMRQRGARFAQPEVSAEYCIGCGACQYACPAQPVKAVIVRGLAEHETARVLVQEKAEAPKGAEDGFAF